jgi:hypothetical protein
MSQNTEYTTGRVGTDNDHHADINQTRVERDIGVCDSVTTTCKGPGDRVVAFHTETEKLTPDVISAISDHNASVKPGEVERYWVVRLE